jgi:hypothetical protein
VKSSQTNQSTDHTRKRKPIIKDQPSSKTEIDEFCPEIKQKFWDDVKNEQIQDEIGFAFDNNTGKLF